MAKRAEEAWSEGGCHCGAVRFRVRASAGVEVLDCNCSVCAKKGNLHLLVDEDAFELLSEDENLQTYTFGMHVAEHYFCRSCGIHAFYKPRSPSNPNQWDVNVRCLDDYRTMVFERRPFDGHSMEQSVTGALKAIFPNGLEADYIALGQGGLFNGKMQAQALGVDEGVIKDVVQRLRAALPEVVDILKSRGFGRESKLEDSPAVQATEPGRQSLTPALE